MVYNRVLFSIIKKGVKPIGIINIIFILLIYGVSGYQLRKIPDGLSIGTSSSSYQMEGAWNSSDKGESIWDHYVHNTNNVTGFHTGDIACDSYNQYERDVELLKELHVDHYRFSISWTRILPDGYIDRISQTGIEHYNRLIDLLIANHITPVVTIYHWDLPQKLQEFGGWTNRQIVKCYLDYANLLFKYFGDRVKYWVTINEPLTFCVSGYGGKVLAPAMNKAGIGEYLCGHHVLIAHGQAYRLYNEKYRKTQNGKISMALDISWTVPASENPEDISAANTIIQFEFGWFAHPIYSKNGDYPEIMKELISNRSKVQGFSSSRLPQFTDDEIKLIQGSYDYFGLNHYSTTVIGKAPWKNITEALVDDAGIVKHTNSSLTRTTLSWLNVVPWGFTKLLNWIKENYDNPEVFILENGVCDHGELKDFNRINYFKLYINALLDAIDDGCRIIGYTSWSLLDNFEWLSGYTQKFGLFHVDFDDPSRKTTPKYSSYFFKNLIDMRAITWIPRSNQ